MIQKCNSWEYTPITGYCVTYVTYVITYDKLSIVAKLETTRRTSGERMALVQMQHCSATIKSKL